MTHEYIRQASHSYLILKDDSDSTDAISYQLSMLEKCPIEGLLPFTEGHLNETTVCQYDITSLKPLPVLASATPFSSDAIRNILTSLLKTVEMVEDCLLSADHLLLDPEFCYLDPDLGQISLKVPYIPFCRQDIFKSMADFSTYLATHAAKSDPDAVVLACRIRHELQEPNVVLSDLKPYLQLENENHPDFSEPVFKSGSTQTGIRDAPTPSSEFAEERLENVSPKHHKRAFRLPPLFKSQVPERFTIIVAASGIPAAVLIYFLLHLYAFWSMTTAEQILISVVAGALFVLLIFLTRKLMKVKESAVSKSSEPVDNSQISQTCDLPNEALNFSHPPEEDEEGHTMLLSDYLALKGSDCPKLIPQRTAASSPENRPDAALLPIEFDRPRFLIGSSDVLCDKIIKDPTVSRIHAEIIRVDEHWYLFDMNSKNGTSLNRTMLPAEKKVPLQDGDAVSFGAANYIFRE